jgi:hypothetical protein
MAREDEVWDLAFSNVGRLHGEPKNQRDVSRAIQAISGIGPPTNQQCQRTTGGANTVEARKCSRGTGGARVTQPAAHAHTSQSHKSVGSSSRTSQQYSGTRSSHQYVYWQPNVKGPGSTAAANNITPSAYNYPASYGIPGRRPRSSYGAAQPWRLGR